MKFGALIPGMCPRACTCCKRSPVPWRFDQFDMKKLQRLISLPPLDENGKTFQPMFQLPGVAYACTWAEHEIRGHTGRRDHVNWEVGKPRPDFYR